MEFGFSTVHSHGEFVRLNWLCTTMRCGWITFFTCVATEPHCCSCLSVCLKTLDWIRTRRIHSFADNHKIHLTWARVHTCGGRYQWIDTRPLLQYLRTGGRAWLIKQTKPKRRSFVPPELIVYPKKSIVIAGGCRYGLIRGPRLPVRP